MPDMNPDTGTTDQQIEPAVSPLNIPKASTSTSESHSDNQPNADNVTPPSIDESMDDGYALPDLGSKQSEPKITTKIDLPKEVKEEVTLPEVNKFENDDLASDFLNNEVDNSTLLGVNDAPIPDFAKEMSIEQGVDRDLELELENLTFLEDQ